MLLKRVAGLWHGSRGKQRLVDRHAEEGLCGSREVCVVCLGVKSLECGLQAEALLSERGRAF